MNENRKTVLSCLLDTIQYLPDLYRFSTFLGNEIILKKQCSSKKIKI